MNKIFPVKTKSNTESSRQSMGSVELFYVMCPQLQRYPSVHHQLKMPFWRSPEMLKQNKNSTNSKVS